VWRGQPVGEPLRLWGLHNLFPNLVQKIFRAVNDFHASLALKCNAFWLRFCVYLFIAAWSSPDYPTWACPVVLLPPLKVSLIYSLQNDPRLSLFVLPTP